jgi:peptidoglycan/LPS O-acetylase OafA/YrhL
MGVYLITPVIFWIGVRKPLALFAGAAVLFAAYLVAHLRFGTTWYFNWTYDFGVLRAIPAFMMGVACYRLRQSTPIPFPAAAMWAALTLFVAGMFFHAPGLFLVVCMYAVGLFALAADTAGRPGKLIRAAAPYGQLTYGVYMLHMLVATVFLSILWQRLLQLNDYMWLGAGLGLLLTGAAAYLSLFWFERPARLWISRLGEKGRAPVPADNVAIEQSAAGADLA